MNRRAFLTGLLATAAGLLTPELIVEPRRKLWPGWGGPVTLDLPVTLANGDSLITTFDVSFADDFSLTRDAILRAFKIPEHLWDLRLPSIGHPPGTVLVRRRG
jgi:hypothetical protein